ncbi:GPN-loop GTPase 2 [Coccinella septempunctata]|uniref:GPN-loop GTPase 2 n=1 Tax=Coccinella septempunctata TaxID=41139 RepID=UPI001D073759|nr:GPN-loop GTPase 2 [Coccinella septempunctata]
MALVKRTRVEENLFGQLVIGPPSSGKTTYCGKLAKLYKEKLNRDVAVINLDPANENMCYIPKIDIRQLVSLENSMAQFNLGPNGSLMYCMEYLEENFDWLLNQLSSIKNCYLIFDMPGQVELYTHHSSIKNVCEKLQNLNYNLCCVHMVDSHYCSDAPKFISTLLLSLSTMLHIGIPHVNVLSKADILKANSTKLDFGIDFYTDVLNLEYLLDVLDDGPLTKKFKKLNAALVDLVQDYSLVSFILLNVFSEKSLMNLKSAIDKANGYIYGSGEERNIQSLLSCAIGARTATERFDVDYM